MQTPVLASMCADSALLADASSPFLASPPPPPRVAHRPASERRRVRRGGSDVGAEDYQPHMLLTPVSDNLILSCSAAAAAAATSDLLRLRARPAQALDSRMHPSLRAVRLPPFGCPAYMLRPHSLLSAALPPPPPSPPPVPAPPPTDVDASHPPATPDLSLSPNDDGLAEQLSALRVSQLQPQENGHPAQTQLENAAASSSATGNSGESATTASSATSSSQLQQRPLVHVIQDTVSSNSKPANSSAAPSPLPDASSSPPLSQSPEACRCFAVQYTCAQCKAAAAAAAGDDVSAPEVALASTTDTSCASSVAATGASTPLGRTPPASFADSRFVVPAVSLAQLEAEVKAMYHIADDEEAAALRRNQEAVRKQLAEEQAAAEAASQPAAPTPGATVSVGSVAAHAPPITPRSKSSARPVYSWDEIRRHNSAESCWLVQRGLVYDVTPMLSTHPAGIQSILRNAATDAQVHFDFHSAAAMKLWSKYEIGTLEGYKKPSMCSIQ